MVAGLMVDLGAVTMVDLGAVTMVDIGVVTMVDIGAVRGTLGRFRYPITARRTTTTTIIPRLCTTRRPCPITRHPWFTVRHHRRQWFKIHSQSSAAIRVSPGVFLTSKRWLKRGSAIQSSSVKSATRVRFIG